MRRFTSLAVVGAALWSGGSHAWAQQAGAGAAAQNQAGAAAQGQAGAAAQGQAGAAAQNPAAAAAQNQAGANALTPGAQGGVQFGAGNMGIGQTPWFANPQARQQLGLNDQQFNQLNQMYNNQYTQYKRKLDDILNTDLTPQQRQAQMRQLQQQFRQGFDQNFNQQFGNAPFRDRYNQLNMQYRGYEAFTDPQVTQQLQLTNGQQQRLQSLAADWNAEMQRLSQVDPENSRQVQQQLDRLRRAGARELRTILSQDQYQQWQQMVGDPFDFPADTYFTNFANGQAQPGQQGQQGQQIQQGLQTQPGQQTQ